MFTINSLAQFHCLVNLTATFSLKKREKQAFSPKKYEICQNNNTQYNTIPSKYPKIMFLNISH